MYVNSSPRQTFVCIYTYKASIHVLDINPVLSAFNPFEEVKTDQQSEIFND